LAPSIRQKIHTHHKAVAEVHKILPISRIVVEVAAFDIQKIKNPDISSIGYQQGEQADFWNVREYVLWRDNHTCLHCKGKSKDKILNVHHIESRQTGGDAPNNLITLCETCHDEHHRGEIALKAKRGASFRDAAFMGIMRWAFYNGLEKSYPNVSLTYGYLTKMARIAHGLEKGHCVDAYCIAGNMGAAMLTGCFLQKAVRRHNRQIHKATISKGGKRKLNQAPKVVHGFKLFDKVLYCGQECFVFGRRSSGYFDLRRLDGTKIHASANVRDIKRVISAKALLTEAKGERFFSSAVTKENSRRQRFLSGLKAGVSALNVMKCGSPQ
jgi:N6-L-threonylcarbamoyladenine synthase